MRKWQGFSIPDREADHVLGRRVIQCHEAIERVRGLCEQRRVMVQAGGNWGYWPAAFSQLFGTVYTFEPDAECFECLVRNTNSNVVRIQAALGYDRKLVGLLRDHDTTGNQRVFGEGAYPTLRIDDLALDACDIIYLDIEGCEAHALLGARETIGRHKPIVVFEARRAFQGQVDEAYGLMEGLGYRQDTHMFIGNDVVMRPE